MNGIILICHLNFRQHTHGKRHNEIQQGLLPNFTKTEKDTKLPWDYHHYITLYSLMCQLYSLMCPLAWWDMMMMMMIMLDKQRLMYNADVVELFSFHAELHIKILFQVLKLSCRENIQFVVGKDALNDISMVADCL